MTRDYGRSCGGCGAGPYEACDRVCAPRRATAIERTRVWVASWLTVRRGEVWINELGLFWSRDVKAVRLPSGRWIG